MKTFGILQSSLTGDFASAGLSSLGLVGGLFTGRSGMATLLDEGEVFDLGSRNQ